MEPQERISIWNHGKMNIIGVALCFILFCTGFAFSGNVGLYANLSGFIIVIGGTLTSMFLGFRMERIRILLKVVTASYTRPAVSPDTIVRALVDLSIKRKINGLLSLEKEEGETTIFFLRRAIGLMVDNYTPDQIREALNAEMFFFKKRRDENLRMLRTLADLSPAFGLVGSVVGLIGMLGGIGDSATIMATIPIALTSTLYGIILANLVFHPIAANLRERTSQELLLQRIITEGIVAIAADVHPRVLDKTLKSFLTPAARKEEVISIARIKEHLERKEIEHLNLSK